MTITELVSYCKASVSLDVNDHRAVYQTVEQWLEDENHDGQLEIDEAAKEEMIRTDTCYRLQFYPDTPIGFYVIYGPTLDWVLTEATTALLREKPREDELRKR